MSATTKNAAEYQVSLSAVKKTHFAKSGIDTSKLKSPANTIHFRFRKISNIPRIIKNPISCIFIIYFL